MTTVDSLVDELRSARDELLAALTAVRPESMNTPGLMGEWSGRELIAHLGYWAGHAAEVIHAVEEGRADDVGVGEPSVDEVNETVARIARQTDLATVRKREAASVDALVERIRALDPALLAVRLPDGATLEDGIRDDGPIHYREHHDELRAALEAPARAERDALLAELEAARDAFHDLLGRVDVELVTVPGVMEDWSVRDIVYHLAAWCDHGSDAIELAATGRGAEFAYSTGDTDVMNERFLAEGRSLAPHEVLRREERAFLGFQERIAGLEASLLAEPLGNGDTVAEVIGYDGPEHYAEHTEHLRAWFGGADDD